MSPFWQRKGVKHGVLLDEPVDVSRCAGCAADCCHGFPSVELSDDEYQTLRRLGGKRLEFTLDERFYRAPGYLPPVYLL